MAPSECFVVPEEHDEAQDEEQDDEGDDQSDHEFEDTNLDRAAPSNFDDECVPETQPVPQAAPQFFVEEDPMEPLDVDCEAAVNSDEEEAPPLPPNFFELPQLVRSVRRARRDGEPLIDYSKSIIMTSEEYISTMAAKAARKEAVANEREERKKLAEQKKLQREQERAQKEAARVLRRVHADRKRAEKEREKARKDSERSRKRREAEARRQASTGSTRVVMAAQAQSECLDAGT